jgi:pilus assembly protein CpaB
MNVARVLVLIVALIAGGAAAYLAMNMINQEPAQSTTVQAAAPVAPAIETDEVLVAVRDMPLGTTIDAGNVAWRAWPLSGIAGTYILRSQLPNGVEELAGTIVRSEFFAGEPITQAKLTRTEGGLLSAILPAGMRAIALTISTDTSAGGFILPNDRVDVIMTRRSQAFEDGAERFITETILTNVRVLAIDQTIAEQNGVAVVVGRTATLELTPMQAEILTVAQQMSDRLTLALRSLADADAPIQPDAVHLINGDTRAAGVTVVRNGVAVQVNPGQ